jgi:hypothetical protein
MLFDSYTTFESTLNFPSPQSNHLVVLGFILVPQNASLFIENIHPHLRVSYEALLEDIGAEHG